MLRTTASHTIGVPFLDLGSIHAGLIDDILDEFREVVASGAFTNGPHVVRFESAFAGYCATEECVGLASGLDALRLALEAAGIGNGDEVIVPANTFVATFEAVAQAGAIPVPVDVGDDDYNIDVDAAGSALTERTAAILPVHLYGELADMRAVSKLAARHGLFVLEDACQAHGAERDGFGRARPATLQPSAFTPARTSARSAMPGRRRPLTEVSPGGCVCSESTDSGRSTCTSWSVTRRALTHCRRSCSCASFRTSTAGTTHDVRSPVHTVPRSRV